MLCNKLNSTDSTATLTASTHRQKTASATKKSTDDGTAQPTKQPFGNAKKLSAATNALINRGGGDCAANDVLKRELPKIKLDNGKAMIVLLCEKNSHPFETRIIPLMPHTQCTIGRISSKCRPSEMNAYFDCKVLSRNQAMVWYDDELKFWIKDTQSSNGTYLNGSKLIDEAVQLHSGDVIQLGVNVYENKCKSEVHNCVVASVQLYLPKTKTESIEVKSDHSEISVSSKSLTQQPTVETTDEHHDVCETSRTTVESDVSDKHLKISTPSRISDAARRICINFKDEQSDKAIKIELHSIQSFVEAMSSSKSDAWEAISKEDSYLHRIYTLQNKISILKKGLSEDELQMEKQQWVNEMQLYKLTANEAIFRVGLECKEIALKIEQVETKYKSSEHECDKLRDQIDAKDQSINDFSCLLRHIEIDYDEHKTETKTKNATLNAELQKQFDDLLEQLRKLEMERENLIKKLEELKEFENEKAGETKVESTKISVARKFEQLEKIFKNFKNHEKELFENEDFSKFKETYVEILLQYKELKMLQLKPKSMPPKVEVKPAAVNTKEAGEQTNDFDDFETQLEELQSQLAEQELNAEQLSDMLENECDMCRKKLTELQQENSILILEQQKVMEQKSTQFTDVAVSADENPDLDYEAILKDLKNEFSIDMKKNVAQLTEMEQQLTVCEAQLKASQAEHLKLQAELAQVAEIAQKKQQQHTKLLPIMAPIFLGLLGMCVYLIMRIFF